MNFQAHGRPKVLCHREVTWHLRNLVLTHRTLNTTSGSHRVVFVCPSCVLRVNYFIKITSSCCLRDLFGCHRVTFCRHRTCFGCWLAVDQLRGHLRTKFKIPYSCELSIWCQLRDSVTPALSKHLFFRGDISFLLCLCCSVEVCIVVFLSIIVA